MRKFLLLIGLCGMLKVNAQLTNTVPSSGPVGIGTGNPDRDLQLTVNGGAKVFNGVIVDGVLLRCAVVVPLRNVE